MIAIIVSIIYQPLKFLPLKHPKQELTNNVFDKNDYLFADISDAEMDRLFAFIKN